jgi:hypothetical protein
MNDSGGGGSNKSTNGVAPNVALILQAIAMRTYVALKVKHNEPVESDVFAGVHATGRVRTPLSGPEELHSDAMTNMNTTTPTYGINTDLGRAVPWSGRPIDGGRLRPAPLGMPLEQALSLRATTPGRLCPTSRRCTAAPRSPAQATSTTRTGQARPHSTSRDACGRGSSPRCPPTHGPTGPARAT